MAKSKNRVGRPRKLDSEELFPERLSTAMSTTMLDALKERASSEDRSIGWIVRKAIEDYLGKQSKGDKKEPSPARQGMPISYEPDPESRDK
jgi:hypothetical protein